MSRVEQIGDATLYLGDCRELLPVVTADALVTDPPYGINAARDRHSQKAGWRDYPASGWDLQRPDEELLRLVLASARHAIVWGGNYFTDALPLGGKWLVWDKGQTDFSLADCELAWCSFDGAIRRISFSRGRAMQDGKEHPTQKAVEVMRWCLGQLPAGCQSVLDPFMGAGTTGVACASLGKRFIGIEIEAHYFDIACRRIELAQRQPDMLVGAGASAAPVQEPLL